MSLRVIINKGQVKKHVSYTDMGGAAWQLCQFKKSEAKNSEHLWSVFPAECISK